MAGTTSTDRDKGIDAYTTKDGPRWRVPFKLDGARTSLSFDDIVKARRFKADVRKHGAAHAVAVSDALRAATSRPDAPTLADVFARRVAESNRIKESTRVEYLRMFDLSFGPMLGQMPIDAITPAHIRAWFDSRVNGGNLRADRGDGTTRGNGAGVSITTVRHEARVLGSAFTFALKQDPPLIPRNPMLSVSLPEATARPEIDVMTGQELNAILTHMDPFYRPLVFILALTGMRIGEALALRWHNVHIDGQGAARIRVVAGWSKVAGGRMVESTPKTVGSVRTITIDEKAVAVLAALRAAPGVRPDGYVFKGRQGGHLLASRFLAGGWHPARKAAGIRPLTPHALRHMHASELLGRGRSIESVARRLGDSVKTTEGTYWHIVEAMSAGHVEATSAAYAGVGAGLVPGLDAAPVVDRVGELAGILGGYTRDEVAAALRMLADAEGVQASPLALGS